MKPPRIQQDITQRLFGPHVQWGDLKVTSPDTLVAKTSVGWNDQTVSIDRLLRYM